MVRRSIAVFRLFAEQVCVVSCTVLVSLFVNAGISILVKIRKGPRISKQDATMALCTVCSDCHVLAVVDVRQYCHSGTRNCFSGGCVCVILTL